VANTTTIYTMHKEILENLGLSPNEAKIYETLVSQGQSSVPQISIGTGVHKRNIYDIIPRLLKKGLIYEITDTKEARYAAAHPDKLSDLIWEKESQLNSILPSLRREFKKVTTNEAVYIYKGVEGFKNYLRDILKVGEDVYFIGAKGGWFDSNLQIFIRKFLTEANKKGIKYRHIFDHAVKNEAPELLPLLGKPYKFLPEEYSTTGAIDIFGDHVVTFAGLHVKDITDDVTLIVMVNKELADCYRTWFKFMWDFCPTETKK
jgi:sugar-specific transcriptional regulator TrmB